MPVLRQHHLRHFMAESADHLFAGPKLERCWSSNLKRGKLNPWYIGPFKILKRISLVAYKLELPEELSNVYNTFHISNLKKCLFDESLVIPMKELRLDDKLNFVEEPVEIMDREVKQLKQSRIPIVKNGDAPANASTSTEGPISAKTAKQKLARNNELKAKSTLLLAIPNEHLLKFHGIKDAKTYRSIKARFGGNKKQEMQKGHSDAAIRYLHQVITGKRNGDSPRRNVPGRLPTNALFNSEWDTVFMMALSAEEGIQHCSNGLYIQGAKDKAGLGYDSQMNESKVVNSVFNSKESDVDDSPVNDRFKIGEGFHAILPPYIRNYMPSRPDLSFVGLDDYVYKAKVSETITIASKTSKDSLEKPSYH
ncbi:hypothetical protein Tco_0398106 [Tanacetum coccineum]